MKNQNKTANKPASCDPLTGLHNRNAFFEHATQTIALAARNKNIAAILFICIDRLKVINDTLGENYGNKLLKAIAKRPQFNEEVQHLEKQPYSWYSGWIWKKYTGTSV